MQSNLSTVRQICQENIKKKFAFFEAFWRKEGPFPVLFTEPHLAKSKNYIKYNLVEQHNDVKKLLEDNLLAVEPYLKLIDDGIPAVRPDLGTTLLPSSLGLPITTQPNQHPWLKKHLALEEYLAVSDNFSKANYNELKQGEIKAAEEFYSLFKKGQKRKVIFPCVFPYVPDTQGVFDLSHLILGEDIFLYLYDKPEIIHKVQLKSLKLFLAATTFFKRLIGEHRTSMIHGHGMPIGVWFPNTGTRISEDSSTLISAKMIENFVLPYIKKAIEPFGKGFLHYCGKYKAQLILVSDYHPKGDVEKIHLVNLWHKLTGSIF